MAQKKLLSVLVVAMGFCLLVSLKAFANDEVTWAQDLRSEAAKMTLDHLMEKVGESKVYGEDVIGEMEDTSKSYELKIFVSTSMPINLLRAYASEAAKYGGTLVLKGLPGGEFKSLLQLVRDIEGRDGIVGSNIQIDQEAFETYSVSSVPTIVLAREENCYFQETCKKVFDKIIGNVGLVHALDKFSQEGDLKALAGEIRER